MKFQSLLISAIVAFGPSVSYAMCTGDYHEVAISCAEGQAWDEATEMCIDIVTG